MATFSPPKHTSGFLVAPRVPQGLAAAVEGLTREVIRNKPEDIYVFAARHFENLLQLREQYETSGIPLERDPRTLRDMGLTHVTSPERRKTSTQARLEAERSGWSLNQTAKVLKRHRSIITDSPTSQDPFHPPSDYHPPSSASPPHHICSKTPKNSRRPSRPFESSPSSSQSGDSEPRTTPKILSRMSTEMTSRDIKNELRKNRISSRERRSKPRRPEAEENRSKIEGFDTSESFETQRKPSKRSSDRSRRPEDRRKDKQNGGSPSDDKMSRTPSMDKVKDYVVRKFSSTKSLEELQSLNYVEKVQSIIDSTEPIIREKIEELKNEMINSRKRSNASESLKTAETPQAPADVLESRLNDTQRLLENVSSELSKPPGRSRSARALRRIRSVSMISTEDINGGSHERNEEFMISELLISNGQRDGLDVRIKDHDHVLEDRKYRRSHSAKGSRRNINIFEPEKSPDKFSQNEALESMLNETRSILADISTSFSFQNGHRRSRGSASASSSSKSDDCDFQDMLGLSKVSLPEVRPKSSKNTNRSLQKNNLGDIVLPAISPEAPKSSKIREELILPVLSPPNTSKDPEIPELPVEEVFKDSLNVSPEPSDLQRPDSLEPEERIEDIEPPTSELKQKLLEIHEAEKKIEKVFRSESIPAPEEIEPTESDDELKRKLMELMEAEREIENALDGAQKPESPDEAPPSHRQSDQPEDDDEGLKASSRASADPKGSPHTYVLTEGSPYDIPESVTTVIIPEHTPSPGPDDHKLPQVLEELENPERSRDPSSSFGEEIILEEPKDSLIDMIPKKPEMIPKKPEITIPKQNLQCINEEEDLEEDETVDNGTSDPPTSFLDVEEETNDQKSMDASDDFGRPECISMSSTSAKETSITDGPMETPKDLPDSGEDVSTVSASAESSNEAKETTLTDGTSFSIDPTRPFVPELNLDSLQDITVSSFKMTEDEYEPGDNENTNSFTETLTPDERDRGRRGEEGLEGCEDVDEDRSGVSESLGARDDEEEVKHLETGEDVFVKEFVEVREPLCEKKVVYVTGPNEDLGNEEKTEVEVSHEDLPHDSGGDPPEARAESDLDKEGKTDEEKGSESDQGTENLTEEDTPLAVSRSASQCTTRRVSSGNLARMRDTRVEEGEEEGDGRSDEARVKFLGEGEGEVDPGEVGGKEIDIAAVGDDAEDDRERMESKEYHIYVPELDQSEESTTESSFNSAATKIQAGVRGFLTRRRLQRMHHLSSTLNGVPSIQDSIVIDERPLEYLDVPEKDLLELEGAATTIQSNFRGYKARKRLRREDAMQRTTISMERAFGEDGLRHTGEFHDCIPLPLLDFAPRIFTPECPQNEPNAGDRTPKQTVGMMFELAAGVPVLQFGLPPKITKLVDLVVLAKDESAVESGYLNFITSVEDAESSPAAAGFFKPPATPGSDASGESTREFVELSPRKGVIIEEITSLEEAKILSEMKAKETPETPEVPAVPEKDIEELEATKEASETAEEETSTPLEDESGEVLEKPGIDIAGALEAPLAILGFPMKEGKLLRYESEDSMASHDRRPLLEVTLTPGDPMKSLSLSQESQLAGERIESPITMMQIVPGRGASLLQDDSGEIITGEDKKEGEGSLEAQGSAEETKKEGDGSSYFWEFNNL
ncbi:uncharacterized protein LOC114841078 [Diachasma alloeum]|uniref:uncharacterized protein LOC114841078 n=1 Tax=Diachasma alloeum TaxID=454923 RepID=UPI0010FB3CBA|nr:uncharacterized protein LOC114841078 [Diachasma alloeum]